MSQDTLQESLFEDPLGLRFRHARERLRWSLEAAAQQLKLPVAVLDAIEREDWSRLGPAIFARSYISSYARLLGLPAALADDAIPGRPQPDLVSSIGSVPARRVARRPRGARRLLAALAIVFVLAIAAWAAGSAGQLRGWIAQRNAPAAADAVAATPVAPAAEHVTPSTQVPVALAPDPAAATTGGLAATSPDAGLAPATGDAAPDALVLRFRGDSWVEVLGPGGATIERGLVAAGAERRYAAGAVEQVTLGDAAAVEVSRGGATIGLGSGGTAKVARFTVSSDGTIHPSAND